MKFTYIKIVFSGLILMVAVFAGISILGYIFIGGSADNVVKFTAVYNRVAIFSDGFGGDLVTLEPNTPELQQLIFRRVVFFSSATKFIGLDRPVNTIQSNSVLLPESQQIKVTGYYHKPQARIDANIVELLK
ncbi:MAG: hypothetical protein WC817_00025 [Patescibacteria group bacterium]|jgi:hypothetical protein